MSQKYMNTSKIKWSNFLAFKGAYLLLAFIGLCLIISAALGSFVPSMIADLSASYDQEELFFQSIKNLFYLFLGVYFNRALYQLGINKFVKLLVQNVRSWCYEKWLLSYEIQEGDTGHEEKYPQGEIISRIVNDTESVRELVTSGTFGIFIDLFFVVSCMLSFVKINTVMGGALVASQVGAAILLVWGSKYMRTVFLSVRKSRGDVYQTVANLVGGFEETYFTNHGNFASKKSEGVFDDYLGKILKSNIWDSGYYSIAESLYPLLLALVVIIFPFSGITEAAIILVIVDLIQRSIGPVKDIAGKIANVQRAASGIDRISEFMEDLEKTVSSPRDFLKKDMSVKNMSVSVDSFAYPKRSEDEIAFSLNNINFFASRGDVVGIVGISGCGKSTLLKILSGNIIAPNSNIELVGEGETVNFPGAGFEDVIRYRELVGIVSQESHIFSESVAFNICLCEKIPQSFIEFWQWVEEQIPYLVNVWGINYESVLDQKTISLGQKQLLSAIRSCYLKKPVVLFDEVSSGLDSELELALRKVVELIQKQSLTFVVAHRLETVIGANQIIVMDNGSVVDKGSHSELLQRCTIYGQFLQELSH
ncbi:ABC transporter ATP-binding protein [Halobacteriovorax sp. HLS]|uniref:ATP-binding cassette domain-containing protein n=1 Tax=Halobacteriovorax sp. HLS TaxID=2234000 RepID=UPI000FDC20AA|nr:ABC transporter ATP-binding protein [Halobacteriovorax sp. HLS]